MHFTIYRFLLLYDFFFIIFVHEGMFREDFRNYNNMNCKQTRKLKKPLWDMDDNEYDEASVVPPCCII